jgi:transglutaminase-like putative cysteine protease
MTVRDLSVRLTTRGFLSGQGLKQKDFSGEVCRLTEFVRDDIRYVGDIDDTETLHTAEQVLLQGAGDCDDKALLLAAMLLSIGRSPVRFVAGAWDKPGEFEHVWLQWHDGARWVDLETTEPLPCGQSVDTRNAVDFMTQDI